MEREPEPSEQAVNLCSVFSKNGGEIVSDEPMGMVNAMVMVRGPELSEQALRRQAEIESEPQLMNEPDPWEEAPEPSEQAVNDVAILSDERIGMVSAMVMERGPELSEQALRRLAEIESERQLMNPDPWEEEPEPSEQSVNQHEEQLENHPDPLEQEQVVNPWKVSAKKGGKVDYNKIIDEFGCKRLDEPLIDRVQRLTSRQPHVFLRRGVFFAHRDFNLILDAYERGDKFYLYTGRGPSSEALHLGHLIPFMFTKYLQEAFKVPLVIQLTDDEKCIWKNITVEESQRLGRENAKDIIACGFDVTKTFIFSDFDYVGGAFYKNMVKVSNCLSVNKAKATFGFTDDDQIGKLSFPPVQAVPSFPSSFPHLFPGKDNLRCLIPCAIDQDPYFRMTRDIAPRLGYCKPALIESSFFPALKGENGKMSASDPNSAIYVTDTAKDIKKKVNSAVSGGKDLAAEQAELGADLEKDVPVKYLHFFLENDYELEHIKKEYGEGRMQTGAVKGRLVEVLTEMVERHRRARAGVTDEMVDAFMAVRPLPYMFE